MKKIFYVLIAGCAFLAYSCKSDNQKPVDPQGQGTPSVKTEGIADPVKLYEVQKDTMVAPSGEIASTDKFLSNDIVEHQMAQAWSKISIKVKDQPDAKEPDLKEVLRSIAEVYPTKMLLEWVNGTDHLGNHTTGNFIEDDENHIITGKWQGPDYDNNFSLKAWKMIDDTWTIGYVGHYLWDGDDGVGVYQTLMFWTFDPEKEKILRPITDEAKPLPVYTPERGYVVFAQNNDNLDFSDSADPDRFWMWNGHWFESR